MEKEYKVGDLVKISRLDDLDDYLKSSMGLLIMSPMMVRYIGKTLLIRHIDYNDNTVRLEHPHIDPDDERLDAFWFHMNWLEDAILKKKSIKISDLV